MGLQLAVATAAAGLIIIAGLLPDRLGWGLTIVGIVSFIGAFFIPGG